MIRRAEQGDEQFQADKRSKLRKRQKYKKTFENLPFMDNCNAVVHMVVKDMDRALNQAAGEYKLGWHTDKNWKNGVHLGVNLDATRHQRFREKRENAAYQIIRRLITLLPREKKKIVVQQLLPILRYGAELDVTPTKRGEELAAEWN